MADQANKPKRLTKAQFIASIAEETELSKKQVSAVLDAMNALIYQQLGKKGPGEVLIPKLVKLRAVKKPAQRERKGLNPFTKQPQVFKAKPASVKIRAIAVKAFKDGVKL